MKALCVSLFGMLAMSCTTVRALPATQSAPTGEANRVAPWERLVDGALENKGLAKVERFGARWVLTVVCGGVHTTYLDAPQADVETYVGAYVAARYTYVVRTFPDPRCFREPCDPVSERRMAIVRLKRVAATVEQERALERHCD